MLTVYERCSHGRHDRYPGGALARRLRTDGSANFAAFELDLLFAV